MIKLNKSKIIIFILLFLIFCFSFFIRVYFSYGTIISDGVVKYGDDAIYHMRFLENMLLGGHFPSFIYFDAFTNFPHGTYVGIAPLYDFLIGAVIWIITLGKPTLEIINKVAPFYPVVLGSLIPIVIYFIAKVLFNNPKVSLVSAFLAGIIPPILFKSMLGSNDHHVAEVLFSSLAMMFLMYALKCRKDGVSIKNKKLWFFSLLCGLSLGLYFLIWRGALIFLLIILCFIVLSYFIEFIRKRPVNWILVMGLIIFSVSFLAIIPFFGHPNLVLGMYNINHLIAFGMGFFSLLFLWISGRIIDQKLLKRWLIIIFFILAVVILLLIFKLVFPYVFQKILILSGAINNNGLSSINFKNFVSEMVPLTYQGAVGNFGSLFFLFLVGFFTVCYKYIREKKLRYFLFIVWTVASFLITGIIPFIGQRRYDIYLAINIVLLSSFVIVKGLEIGWKSLNISSRLEEEKFPFKNYFLIGSLSTLFLLVFFLVYPFPFNAGLPTPQSWPSLVQGPLVVAKNPLTINEDWYLLLTWLKEKTPDPGLDYYALYSEPGINSKTGAVNDYLYSEQAYGILAPWEYGHAIEYYARRIPVANPFQQGIGKIEDGKVVELGSGVFFLETDEARAISYLDQLKVKYVLIDSKYADLGFTLFNNLVEWVQGDLNGYINEPENALTKFDNSMVARLDLLDGRQDIIEKKVDGKDIDLTVGALEHFRLLYESSSQFSFLSYRDSNQEVKTAKVFEYVRGARIVGKATTGKVVNVSIDVVTNQGREFTYKNEIIVKNGAFDFIVPYSTGKQENSDVFTGDYTIRIGNYTRNIKVSEEDVLQGKTIEL